MTLQPTVNLTNCDREPIQIPGSIQPHGCLLACNASASVVLRHSANTLGMLGVAGEISAWSIWASSAPPTPAITWPPATPII